MAGKKKKLHPVSQWLKDSKDQLAAVTYILGILGILITVIVQTKRFIEPYTPQLLTALGVLFALATVAFLLVTHIVRWRAAAKVNAYPYWTSFILFLGAYAVLMLSLQRQSNNDHAQALGVKGYDNPIGLTFSYGMTLFFAVVFLTLVIWVSRFYWDTSVRLKLLEDVLNQKLQIELADVRRHHFDNPMFHHWRYRWVSLLRVAAPTDLAYIEPKDRPPSAPAGT
jgi:hypothetical protein